MTSLRRWLTFLLLSSLVSTAEPRTSQGIAVEILAPLLDPVKIATLKGERPVNGRLYRILGWLEAARLAGADPAVVIGTAQTSAGYGGSPRALADRAALCHSWRNLHEFGCFTPEGIVTLKKGGSPTVTRGQHAGEKVHIDHILPRSLVPELDASLYNLEPIPSSLNASKGAKVSKIEVELARRWHGLGLLSESGLGAVEKALTLP